MEITTMQMYWLVMLDNIIDAHYAILILCTLFCFIGIPMLGAIGKEELYLPLAKKAVVVSVALVLSLTFIPTTKQMAAIMIVPKIANSEKVQTIGNKIYDLAVEWMEELEPNKKESKVKDDKNN